MSVAKLHSHPSKIDLTISVCTETGERLASQPCHPQSSVASLAINR